MIPITLITGFLGAGKTTLLANLLKHRGQSKTSKKLAIIVNEFAELGLDGKKLPQGDYEMWELNRGSIFCVCMRTDFIKLLEKLANEVNPDEIWVEATGIADVSEIFKMISVPTLKDKIFVRTNICLVDPHTICKIITILKAAQSQVKYADCLIVNKIDLADSHQLELVDQTLRKWNANAPIIKVENANVDFNLIPSIDLDRFESPTGEGHKPQAVYSVSVVEPWIFDLVTFTKWVLQQADQIWRIKGLLQTTRGPYWLEGTIHELKAEPYDNNQNVTNSSIALIGPNLKEDQVRAALSELKL